MSNDVQNIWIEILENFFGGGGGWGHQRTFLLFISFNYLNTKFQTFKFHKIIKKIGGLEVHPPATTPKYFTINKFNLYK